MLKRRLFPDIHLNISNQLSDVKKHLRIFFGIGVLLTTGFTGCSTCFASLAGEENLCITTFEMADITMKAEKNYAWYDFPLDACAAIKGELYIFYIPRGNCRTVRHRILKTGF